MKGQPADAIEDTARFTMAEVVLDANVIVALLYAADAQHQHLAAFVPISVSLVA